MEMTSATFSDIVTEPVAKIWALVSDFPNLQRWHPALESCKLTGGAESTTRLLKFPGMWFIEELIKIDHDEHFIEYRVLESSRATFIGAKASVKLHAEGASRTRVTLAATPNLANADAAAIKATLEAGFPNRMDHLRAALDNGS